MTNYYTLPAIRTMQDVMAEQYPTMDGWVCPNCQNHRGGLNCKKNIMICWVGANMSGCIYFIKEKRRTHD